LRVSYDWSVQEVHQEAFMPVVLTGPGTPAAIITLDAPGRLNAFDRQDLDDLAGALDRCAGDDRVRCLVIRGRGHAFCAGADLALVEEIRRAPAGEQRAALALAPSVVLRLAQFPKPTVAVVQGAAFGGGACLALACDDVVLAEDARLGFIFTSLGLPGGDSAATWLLSRRIGARRAWRLLSGGGIVGAAEAATLGLADAVVPADRLGDEAAERAAAYGRRSPAALAATKQQLLRLEGAGSFLEPALDQELADMAAAFAGPDLAEGLAAHHEKREPRWPSAGPAGPAS
jgi:enoyl-CoA hydratase/carnithine racemase